MFKYIDDFYFNSVIFGVAFRVVLDKIVEAIDPYLNNFIRLRKNHFRRYRFEETNMSKLGEKGVR